MTKHEAIELAVKEWHTGGVKEMSLPQHMFQRGVEYMAKWPQGEMPTRVYGTFKKVELPDWRNEGEYDHPVETMNGG